jgi:serine/threonine protein kinase
MLDDPGPVAGSGPTYIGRYRSERVVGSGAFATVWLAEDETLAAPVAIKVLAENWAHDDEVRQRFLEEARILWRADSDHIVRIHNVDQLPDGRPYFVMDFADRGTLQDRMRGRIQSGGRYSVEEAVAISLAIADGLKVAHGLGVVHRDLKPANIMFQSVPAHLGDSRDEKLILTDFGMAKSVARARGTTIATGTPYYMAPEQTEGRADERSDIYSAGVVLYELLAGRVPYPYDSPGRLFAAQVAEPPTPITSLRDDVPPALADTLNHALASDPDKRWPTADAWAGALEAAAKGEPTTPPVPLPGVDPDVLKTMGPAEIAAVRAAAEEPPPAGAAPVPPAAAPAAAAAAAATPPPSAPPPAPPPPPSSGDEGRRKRKRALAIGGPVALVALGVVAAVLAIVLTGAKNADAKTLTLDPIAALGTNPFTASVVPPKNASTANLPVPKNIPAQLLGSSTATTISNTDLKAKLGPIYTALLANLNPAMGALSGLKLPLSNGLKNTTDDRPRIFTGSAPGLYGGTQLLTVCDKKQMIAFLLRNEDKLRAWAAVQGISPSAVPAYISQLTDVVLQFDTRVTNHGYDPANLKAYSIDEVLQRGTAVLIDQYGIPRARCYCGNPLTPPLPLAKNPKIVGTRWPGFSIGKTVDPSKGKSTPELGLIDVVTGTTAIYRRVGTPPEAATLVPQIIPPIPGSTTPTTITATTPTTTSTSTTTTTPTTPSTTVPTTTTPPATPVNVTSDGTATASSQFSSQFPASNGVDGNLATSWFSVGNKEGDTSTFTWTSTHGAILVDHITLYSNSQNSIANIRSGYTFTSIQVSVLHNGVVTASTTVPYPSVSVTVPLGHVGDTVKLLLIHHTNPACGGFGELEVFGSPVSSGSASGASAGASSSSDAEAIVRTILDKNKSSCTMSYTTVKAFAVGGGWYVDAQVVTSGNPGQAQFSVGTGGTTATPSDQLASEIEAGCH